MEEDPPTEDEDPPTRLDSRKAAATNTVNSFQLGGDLRGCRLSVQDDRALRIEHRKIQANKRDAKHIEHHMEKVANMRALWLMPSDDRKLYPLKVNASHREDVNRPTTEERRRQPKEDADMNFTTQMCKWCENQNINKCFLTKAPGVIMEEDPEMHKKKYKGGGTLALAFQVSKYLADEVEGKTHFAKAKTLFDTIEKGPKQNRNYDWWAKKIGTQIDIIFLGDWVPFSFWNFLAVARLHGVVRVYPPLGVVEWCYSLERRQACLRERMMPGGFITVDARREMQQGNGASGGIDESSTTSINSRQSSPRGGSGSTGSVVGRLLTNPFRGVARGVVTPQQVPPPRADTIVDTPPPTGSNSRGNTPGTNSRRICKAL
nr:hypothetical protein [Rhodobacter sp.]